MVLISFFYFATVEYGASISLLKPFLHTWSLGVEEQFYIVFSFIAILAYRFNKQYFLVLLVILSFGSLLFSEFMVVNNPRLNFYLPFSRFWEMAVGSILAVLELKKYHIKDRFLVNFLSTLGVILILLSVLFFNSYTPHPSFYKLIPVLGVALIIACASQENLIGIILGNKLFVGIGLISYSLYLWHFPIFVLFRNSSIEVPNIEKALWIILVVFLSIISFFIFERPFRNKDIISTRVFMLFIGVSATFIISIMCYIIVTDGAWARYSNKKQDIAQKFNKREYSALEHPLGEEGTILIKKINSVHCYLRDPKEACGYKNEKFVFLGDSFSGHYERAMLKQLEKFDIGFISLTYGQCPFVSNDMWFGTRPECPYINEQRKAIISAYQNKKYF